MNRYLLPQIVSDLKRKMVFVAGPRQVGKTTLAKKIPNGKVGYLNWDIDKDRERILTKKLPPSKLWVFDEIHKYRRWRNYLKGIYDHKEPQQQILVTGSAKLDYYRFGGDSLQGRYHFLRLHPLTVAELKITTDKELQELLKLGGFPEPFLTGSEKEARRWSLEYRTRLIKEEVTGLEDVKDLGTLELLSLRLPELTGSPLSINGLAEDLQVAHRTVDRWLHIFERLYSIFRLSPFGGTRIKAVKKERKHYHFDWSLVKDESDRFENLVASHLLKWVHYNQDTEGREYDLSYFRDIEGREVDFVVTEDRKPIYFIECKLSAREVSKNLRYLKNKFPEVKAYQLCAKGNDDYLTPDGIRVCPALVLLRDLI